MGTADPSRRAVELLERVGLIDANQVVAGLVTAHDYSRSNLNIKVSTPDKSYFVKFGTCDRDASGLSAGPVSEQEALRTLRRLRPNILPWLPLVVHSSEADGILVLPFLHRMSLREAEASGMLPTDETFERIGAALAVFHGARTGPADGLVPAEPAFGYYLEPRWSDVLQNGSCYRDVLRIIAGSGPIAAGLRSLDKHWVAATPIHSDLRWENILVETEQALEPPLFTFVDLETFQLGDPRWDVACVLADFTSSWIQRTAKFAGWDRGIKHREQNTLMPQYLHSAGRFWAGYSAHQCTGAMDTTIVAKMVAARLIQFSVESAVRLTDLNQTIVDYLQIAENVFKNPSSTGVDVVGLNHECSSVQTVDRPAADAHDWQRTRLSLVRN